MEKTFEILSMYFHFRNSVVVIGTKLKFLRDSLHVTCSSIIIHSHIYVIYYIILPHYSKTIITIKQYFVITTSYLVITTYYLVITCTTHYLVIRLLSKNCDILSRCYDLESHHYLIITTVTWLKYCRYGVKTLSNQSINHSINHLINQSINQSINHYYNLTTIPESPLYG